MWPVSRATRYARVSGATAHFASQLLLRVVRPRDKKKRSTGALTLTREHRNEWICGGTMGEMLKKPDALSVLAYGALVNRPTGQHPTPTLS
jgi:hypothetical protein